MVMGIKEFLLDINKREGNKKERKNAFCSIVKLLWLDIGLNRPRRP